MLVGFSGKIGSGKSLAADIAKSHIGRRYYRDTVEIRSFAAPLKKMIAAWAGIDDWRLLSTPEVKSKSVPEHITRYIKSELPQYSNRDSFTFREALQFIGTDIIRAKVPDFWIESTLCDYTDDKIVIIDDCRFIDEAVKIQSLGGKLIRINPLIREDFSTHESEVQLDDYDFDHIILNDKSKGKITFINQITEYIDDQVLP